MVGSEEIVGDGMNLFWRDSVNLLIKALDVFLATVVQEALAEVEGELLAIVGGYAYLSLQLSFGGIELLGSERCSHQAVEFASHQSQTVPDVGMVATEVDAPRSSIAIVDEGALDGVYQPMTFAQGDVETCIHARSAEDVVHNVERHAPRVVNGVGATARHHMSLMGVHVDSGRLALPLSQGEGG